MKTLRKLPNSEDIMKEASSKLEKVKRERDIESIIFAKYEKYQKHLSLFEQKLSNSIFSQKLNINQKTFFKIYSFLEKFSKEEQISINDFPKIFDKKDEENENNSMNKVMILEKENEKIVKDYHIIKKENEVLKSDNEELKKINNKLNIQYVQLNIKIEAEEKNKKLYDEQINKFKNNIYILESKLKENNKIIEELRKKLKNYEEKIKLSLEKAISDKNFMNFYKNSNIKNKKVNFMYLIKSKQLNN
jgi:predicted RNase H-like nuclease (RuvC/YqgF family)